MGGMPEGSGSVFAKQRPAPHWGYVHPCWWTLVRSYGSVLLPKAWRHQLRCCWYFCAWVLPLLCKAASHVFLYWCSCMSRCPWLSDNAGGYAFLMRLQMGPGCVWLVMGHNSTCFLCMMLFVHPCLHLWACNLGCNAGCNLGLSQVAPLV